MAVIAGNLSFSSGLSTLCDRSWICRCVLQVKLGPASETVATTAYPASDKYEIFIVRRPYINFCRGHNGLRHKIP